MQSLTSPHNPLLKAVRRAIGRGTLTDSGLCVAEGFHLLEEASRSGCEIANVLLAESARPAAEAMLDGIHAPVSILPDALFREISTTEASQGVITLARPPSWTFAQTTGGVTVVLDGVQDPGNAGAIVRTAEAFGASGVVFLKGTVSPHNPKSLRASAGSLFRLPFVYDLDADSLLLNLKQSGVKLFAAMPGGDVPLHHADLRQPCAILIGGEGAGVRAAFTREAVHVRIPTAAVESLNAAVAAAVILYEAQRQRTIA